MNLILPTEGDDDDVWDTILNDALGFVVDEHTHEPGKGVAVPSAGLNINADVPAGTNAITGLKAIDFEPVAAAAVAAYAGAFFVNTADSELYYRTVGGVNVKVTSGAALNVGAFTGGIGGDYSAVGALVAYVDANNNYTFKQEDPGGGRPWAGLASGQVDIFEQNTLVVNRVRLQSPAALAASYALTLFAALPGTQQLVQVTPAGVMLASNVVPQSVSVTGTITASGDVSGDDLLITGARARWIPPSEALGGVQVGTIGWTFLDTGTSWNQTGATVAANPVFFPINLDQGDQLLAWNIRYNKLSGAGTTVSAALYKQSVFGALVLVGAVITSNAAAPGNITLGAVGVNEVFGQDKYVIKVSTDFLTADGIFGADIAWNRP
jgi:hypothetical protein